MARQINTQTKINRLISEWAKGSVSTSSHLKEKGFDKRLLDRYKKSHWIEAVGRGAYKLYTDNVEWYGGLYALQTQLGFSIHAGGKTALELKGYAHYLSEKIQNVFLFGHRGEQLPEWFKEFDWGVSVNYTATNLFPGNLDDSFSDFDYRDFSIKISSPERAAMEMLYHIPKLHGFNETYLIMENLASLRPDVVQKLLELCNSIKVKRLFMFMADKHNHPWMNQLDLSKIDLGSGKRVIIENGTLDKKYNITVPEEQTY